MKRLLVEGKDTNIFSNYQILFSKNDHWNRPRDSHAQPATAQPRQSPRGGLVLGYSCIKKINPRIRMRGFTILITESRNQSDSPEIISLHLPKIQGRA